MVDKASYRRRARRERESTTVDHDQHRRALARFLAGRLAPDRWVVLYDAMADEVDLGPLVASQPGRRFALTRTPDDGPDLTVHPWDSPRQRHRLGYEQPRADAPRIADGDIGAVAVPGLAFDRSGHRLGRGAGWYDRFLARLDDEVLRIGVTGDLVLDRLPVEDHDVAMTHLLTGSGVLAVPLGSAEADAVGISSW